MRHGYTSFIACAAVFLLTAASASYGYAQQDITTPAQESGEVGADTGMEHLQTVPPAGESALHEGEPITAETHGGEHGKGGLPQLNPEWFPSQIFWLAISFAILYAFFSKKALPEIAEVQKKRAAHIEHDIATAQKMRESAETAKARYERAVIEAQEKSTAVFLKAEAEIKAKTNAVLEGFKERSAKRVQDTEQAIEKSGKDAMENIHAVAAEIASLAAEKIVGISTDLDQAKTVIRNINRKAA